MPDERETGELVDEKDMPATPEDVNTRLMRLSQNMTRPVWIRVWRRRGLVHVLDHLTGTDYRRGELALVVSKIEAMQCGENGAERKSCVRLQYADGKTVTLPVMEYVWTDKTDGNVRLKYVDREEMD